MTKKGDRISDSELKKILGRVVWDYNIPADELLAVFQKKKTNEAITVSDLHARMLNIYRWHDLIKWFGFETAQSFLKDEAVQKVFPPTYRQKLINAKEILRKNAVPVAG